MSNDVQSKYYFSEYIAGKISRREFVGRMIAAGAALGTINAMVGNKVRAAGPQKGGHMTVAGVQGSTTDNLDPTKLTSGFINTLFYTVYSQLTEVAPNGELVPLLAESYEPKNNDPSEWIFNLRKGVQFHNGKTVDADDVIASIDRHRGEKSESAMKSFAEEIETMTKDGPERVIFKLKTASVDFPFILSASTLSILPSKDGKVTEFGIGAGAYSLKKFTAGQNAEYAKTMLHSRRVPHVLADTISEAIERAIAIAA